MPRRYGTAFTRVRISGQNVQKIDIARRESLPLVGAGRSGVNPPPLPPFEWKGAAAANATYQENAQRSTTISMGQGRATFPRLSFSQSHNAASEHPAKVVAFLYCHRACRRSRDSMAALVPSAGTYLRDSHSNK
jgi:hypothetical protein